MDNYSKYIKYKKKYLNLKGGAFKIGSRVKRIKGADVRHADGSMHPAEAIGKVGTILGIREEGEWPPNSGTILPKAYWVSFDNHYQGTKHEGVRIAVIAEDLVESKEEIKREQEQGNVLNNKIMIVTKNIIGVTDSINKLLESDYINEKNYKEVKKNINDVMLEINEIKKELKGETKAEEEEEHVRQKQEQDRQKQEHHNLLKVKKQSGIKELHELTEKEQEFYEGSRFWILQNTVRPTIKFSIKEGTVIRKRGQYHYPTYAVKFDDGTEETALSGNSMGSSSDKYKAMNLIDQINNS